MGFAFGEDGAIGSITFCGMEIEAKIEARNVSERDFVYGCVCLAIDLLSHYMAPAKAAAVLEEHIARAVAVQERHRAPKGGGDKQA